MFTTVRHVDRNWNGVTMSDLIDRQALKESIEKLYQCDWKVVRDTMFIAQAIDDLPSAEPEERTAKVMNDGINYCENCEGYVEAPMAYCPYCGARLEWK